jgi:ubiquinone/menaquinone biosynthesis C-methylase UbiE
MKLNFIERLYVNSPVRYGLQSLVFQWFKTMLLLKPKGRILEIGCGRGIGAKMILRNFDPEELCLIDIDQAMIEKAQSRVSANGNTQVSFCRGDAEHLPFADSYFDAVFGFGFLHHVPAWRKGLSEIARVLKLEGKYYIEEFYPSLYQNLITKHLLVHPDSDRFNSSELREAFAETDLALVHTFELKRLGILAIGVKTEGRPFSCKEFSDACHLPGQ